jgi:hypothetical protein
MKATWRFPALVRGTPPHPKEERLCLVSGSVEVTVREVDVAVMPLVMTAKLHFQEEIEEFRIFEGGIYRSIDEDYDVLEVESDCGDIMGYGFTYLYSDIAEEIVGVMKSGTERIWPKDANMNRQKGARELENSGVTLTSDGEMDLEFWRNRFLREIDRFILADGKTWKRVAEPVFSLDVDRRHAILEDASCFVSRVDECGKRHYANSNGGQRCRMFAVTDIDALRDTLSALGVDADEAMMDKVDVMMPDVFKLDIDRLEMDRVARVAVDHVARTLTMVKPGGGETFLQVVPSAVTASWMEMRDFLSGYDPLEGVPDGIEDVVGRFVEQTDLVARIYGPTLVSQSMRDGIAYGIERWDNRQVALSAAHRMPLGM